MLSRRCWFICTQHIYVVCAPPADAVSTQSRVGCVPRGVWGASRGVAAPLLGGRWPGGRPLRRGGHVAVPVGAARPAGRRRGAAGGGADRVGPWGGWGARGAAPWCEFTPGARGAWAAALSRRAYVLRGRDGGEVRAGCISPYQPWARVWGHTVRRGGGAWAAVAGAARGAGVQCR